MRTLVLLGAGMLAGVSACGGQAVSSAAPPAPVDQALGPVLDVPGGAIHLGWWNYDAKDITYRPATCMDGTGSTKAHVGTFRLMRLEVTYAQYALCVGAGRCEAPSVNLAQDPSGDGPWSDPSRSQQPAGVTYAQARAYCRAYGGDLPTFSQWLRAAEGDDDDFGIKRLTDAYLRCTAGQSDPLCDATNGAAWTYAPGQQPAKQFRPLPDVGTSAWDVGPYGHADLFGSAAEWVRPYSKPRPFDCADLLDDDFYAPDADPPPDQSMPVMQIARDLYYGDGAANPSVAIPLTEGAACARKPGDAAFFTGFRCAFAD